jgi:hypothetical protein
MASSNPRLVLIIENKGQQFVLQQNRPPLSEFLAPHVLCAQINSMNSARLRHSI